MKMLENAFADGLTKGEKQIGLWVSLASNFAAEVIAPSGFDWLLIDMEHNHNDYISVLSQLQALEPYATTPIVRAEWNDPVVVKRLLDMGVQGVLFPMIQTVEEAKAAVASTRYPPRGVRGYSGQTRANRFGRVKSYLEQVEAETAVLLQIESQQALDHAVEIATVDGVDGVFFGPGDIAADIGYLGGPLAPEVWDKIMPAARAVMDAGIPVGTLVSDSEFAIKLLNEGFTFVACGSDVGLLSSASDALAAKMNARVKQS